MSGSHKLSHDVNPDIPPPVSLGWSKHERYKRVRYWPSFQAIQQLYLIHRQEQIARIEPWLWYAA